MKNDRELGKTGLSCPPVIYGTSYMGNLYRELGETEKLALMQEWFKVGDDRVMIDTAGKYGAGLALEVIGRGLRTLGIKRDQITISNKLGWYRIALKTKEPVFEPGTWANLRYDAVQKISYKGILECWQQGCELMGNGYRPDLVSVHDPDEYLLAATDKADRQQRLNDVLDAYRALFDLKEKGEVKAVGIGSKDWLVIKELYENVKFDWVMFANKFTLYHHPKEIISFMDHLYQDGVGVINSAIFNAGFLTGGDYFDYHIADPNNAADRPLFIWRDRFFSVCEKYRIGPGDACLKFALSAPQVTAVVLNPGKPHRMAHNKAILNEEIPKAFWQELKKTGIIDSGYPYL